MNVWRGYVLAGFLVLIAAGAHADDPPNFPVNVPTHELFQPEAIFRPGMTPDQVKTLFAGRKPHWKMRESEEFLLRRGWEQSLPNERFIQAIIAREERDDVDHSYLLRFTSPLGHSQLYKVTQSLKRKTGQSGFMKLTDWSDFMLKRFGAPQRMTTLESNISLIYYLGTDHRPLSDGKDRCRRAGSMYSGLELKTDSELAQVLSYIDETGCREILIVSADSGKDGLAESLVVSIVDMKRQAEDTRARWWRKPPPGR
ncbi:hypothetical protein [Neorhizobium alkalisoli]|uniref:Uncharacterized protein n=1 Tax=Neorhizobium alkalisoli TaxID=528178 RepID=A0A561QHG4_9HYPH|nr:hypothetical protein [Neorhizobium alkalisoli]TWF49776.1 hypothetical protein FHW37_107143 [Neorhizobium alkalisoli]